MRVETFIRILEQFPNDATIYINGIEFNKDGYYENKLWKLEKGDLDYIRNPDPDIANSVNIRGHRST